MSSQRRSQHVARGQQRQSRLCVPCCGSSSRTIETPDTPPRDPPRPLDKPEQTLSGNKRPSTPTPSRPKDSPPANSPKVQDPLEPTDSGTPKGRPPPTTRPYFDLFPSQRKAPPIAENIPFAKAFKAHLERLTPNERKMFLTFNSWSMQELLTEIQRLDVEQGSKRYMRGLTLVGRLSGLVGPLPELVTGVMSDVQPVAVALGVIKTAISIVVSISQSHKEFTLTVRNLVMVLETIEDYSRMDNVDPQILLALEHVYGGFLDFCQEAMPYYAQNSPQSRKHIIFLWHSFDQRFGEIVDDINRGFTRLAEAERIATYERVSNLEYRGILQLLGDLDMEDYRQRLNSRVNGTCSWITNEVKFDEWLDKSSHVFLAVFGNAGTGKTMLLDYIAEIFQKGETRLTCPTMTCTFFFDQSSYNQKTAVAAIKCLIYQLIHQYRSFANLFKASMAKYTSSPPLHKSVPALCSTLKQMIQHINGHNQTRVIIIVDSLHECEEKSLRELLSQFKIMADECKNVKFVVSTRPHHEVTSCLPHSRASVDLHSKIKGDIELITRSRVKDLAHKNKYDQITQTLVQNAIIREAGTCALWVDLTIRALDNTYSSREHLLLQQINEVPEKLSDVYRHMLENIKVPNQQIATRALTTLLSTYRPLTIIELATVAIIDSEHYKPVDIEAAYEPNRVRRILGPLIRLRGGQVDLAHSSLKSYLLSLTTPLTAGSVYLADADRGTNMEQMMAESAPHDAIAKACIFYLSWIFLDKDIGGVTKKKLAAQSAPSLDENALLTRTEQSRILRRGHSQNLDSKDLETGFTVRAFFDYAARYWPFHYSLASAEVAVELQSYVMFLLGHRHPSGNKMARTILSKWTEEYRDFRKDLSASNFPASSELTPFVLAAYFDFTTVLRSPLTDRLPRLIHTLDNACKWAAKTGHLKALKDILVWRESYRNGGLKSSPGSSSKIRPGFDSALPELDWIGIMVNLLPSLDDFFENHYNLLKGDNRSRCLTFRKSKLNMFKLLAKKSWNEGCKITQRDKQGRTILSHIAESGDTDMLQLLLLLIPQQDRKLLLNDKGDNARLTPVCWALKPSRRFGPPNDPIGIVKALCREGDAQIQLEGRDSQGRTPIALASLNGLPEVVTHLALSKPEVVDIPDILGRTPLSLAAEHEAGSIVAGALIRTGRVDIESRSNLKLTPLHYAVQKANLELIRVLVIEAGATLGEVIEADFEEKPQLKIEVPTEFREVVLDTILGLIREVGIDLRGARRPSQPQKRNPEMWSKRYHTGMLTMRSNTLSSNQTSSYQTPSDPYTESLSRQTSINTQSIEDVATRPQEPQFASHSEPHSSFLSASSAGRLAKQEIRQSTRQRTWLLGGSPGPSSSPTASQQPSIDSQSYEGVGSLSRQQRQPSTQPRRRAESLRNQYGPPQNPPAGLRPQLRISTTRARFAESNPNPRISESRDEDDAS